MKDIATYRIELRGQASESELNALSPIGLTVKQIDAGCAQLTFETDQSGLVGLIRQLHGMGFIFISIRRIEWST